MRTMNRQDAKGKMAARMGASRRRRRGYLPNHRRMAWASCDGAGLTIATSTRFGLRVAHFAPQDVGA